MANKDYYEILGVSKNASQNDIKLAFRKLAHAHHPDKGGDPAKFKEANEAYQVLGNEQKRKQYDQFGSSFNHAGAGGFDFSGFQNGFSGGNVNFDDLGDLFGGLGDMFGFSSGASRSRSRRESFDMEAILIIDFKEAVRIREKIKQIEDQLILKLPIGGFISPQQAAEILEISVSTLKRTKDIIKVRRGMMFLYDKISVAKYKDTGDGYYFILNRTVKNRLEIVK
jgi:molecular chaperone DnaJ